MAGQANTVMFAAVAAVGIACVQFLILYLLCNEPWRLNCFSFGLLASKKKKKTITKTEPTTITIRAATGSFIFSLRYAALQMLIVIVFVVAGVLSVMAEAHK